MADIPPPPPGSPPGQPQYTPPQAPPPSYSDVPPAPPGAPGYLPPGYVPPGGYQGTPAGVSIMSQFRGPAASSVILGLLSVGVPIVSFFVSNGSVFYFYVLPIFGIISGIRAITRGLVIGGIIGIALNVLGGIISLTVALAH